VFLSHSPGFLDVLPDPLGCLVRRVPVGPIRRKHIEGSDEQQANLAQVGLLGLHGVILQAGGILPLGLDVEDGPAGFWALVGNDGEAAPDCCRVLSRVLPRSAAVCARVRCNWRGNRRAQTTNPLPSTRSTLR